MERWEGYLQYGEWPRPVVGGVFGALGFLFVAEIWQISPQMRLLVGLPDPRLGMLTDSTSRAEMRDSVG